MALGLLLLPGQPPHGVLPGGKGGVAPSGHDWKPLQATCLAWEAWCHGCASRRAMLDDVETEDDDDVIMIIIFMFILLVWVQVT